MRSRPVNHQKKKHQEWNTYRPKVEENPRNRKREREEKEDNGAVIRKNNFKYIERPFSLFKTRTKQAIRVALLFITNKKMISVYLRFNFLINQTVMPTARRTKRGFPFPFSATYRRTRAESTFLIVHHLSLDERFLFSFIFKYDLLFFFHPLFFCTHVR